MEKAHVLGLRRLAGALLLLLLLTLAACGPRRAPSTIDTARNSFAHGAFCPLGRVTAVRTIAVPMPRPAIARDPARLAMWREAYERSAEDDPRQSIAVVGCGEIATYACWAYRAREPLMRGFRSVFMGASCSEQSPADAVLR